MLFELALNNLWSNWKQLPRAAKIRIFFCLGLTLIAAVAILLPVREVEFLLAWHQQLQDCGWTGCQEAQSDVRNPVQWAREAIRKHSEGAK